MRSDQPSSGPSPSTSAAPPNPTGPSSAPAVGRGRAGFFSRLGTRELVLLGIITAAGPLTIDLYLPAYPELAAEFGVPETSIQLTLTACVLGLALGQLVIGPFADRFGRRLPVVGGLALWALSSVLVAFAPTLALLTAGRFVQGFVVSAGLVTARAVLRDLSDGQDLAKAFARLFLVVGAVPMVAPFLGSLVLQVTDWRGIFLGLAVVGVLLAVLTYVVLPETLPRSERRPVPVRRLAAAYGSLLVDRAFIAPAMTASLAFAALFVYINGSSFVLQDQYGLSELGFGIVFGIITVSLIVGSQMSSGVVARVGLLTVLRWAPVLGAVSIGAVGVLSLLMTVPLVVLIAGLATSMGLVGVAMPAASAYVLSGQPPARAGLASGLVGVLQFAVGGLVSPLAGVVGGVSVTSIALLMAVLFVAAWGAAALIRPAPGQGLSSTLTDSRRSIDA